MLPSTIELLLKVVAVLASGIGMLEFFKWVERPRADEAPRGSDRE